MIFECTLDYDEYLNRASRSNTGTLGQLIAKVSNEVVPQNQGGDDDDDDDTEDDSDDSEDDDDDDDEDEKDDVMTS
ncbi:MAG: hypothetical protein VXV85_07795, partial [Candidatus Thermoplasmatota archaeon]|nr:hypothetical protein [Candidatus Thermoplasmatota archaeon]